MIYVSQGHERGVGLEVFLKSILLLSPKKLSQIHLFCNQDTLVENLNNLKCNFTFKQNYCFMGNKSFLVTFTHGDQPESTSSLLEILKVIEAKDILITLPTSKDQLVIDNIYYKGYTEFFRKYYGLELSMLFYAEDLKMLLVTDHLPLAQVTKTISSELIEKKVGLSIDGLKLNSFNYNIEEVIFSGINPHCGENGLLGSEDSLIHSSIKNLKRNYKNIIFKGPVSGDSLHQEIDQQKKQLLVYMFHDQGLPFFKGRSGLLGANVTLGLPFLRISVDHGTAFDLYGKNQASILGMNYVLNLAFKNH